MFDGPADSLVAVARQHAAHARWLWMTAPLPWTMCVPLPVPNAAAGETGVDVSAQQHQCVEQTEPRPQMLPRMSSL